MMSEMKDFPKHWEIKELKAVCEVVTGTTPPKADTTNYGNDVPFFKPPHLWDSIISETEEMLTNIGASKARVVPPNTVLVTCIGNLGRTGLVKKEAAFNQQINAILENENLSGRFIFYQAQSPNFKRQLEKLATGTTVSIVNKGNFETIKIVIPPLPEQQAIVSKIEELFSELDNGNQQLLTAQQQLKVYRQSLLKWAFEGIREPKSISVEHCCSHIVDCLHSTAKFASSGFFCVDTTCIENGKILFNKIRYVNEQTYLERISRLKPEAGDILFAREGTVGTTLIVPDKTELCLGQRMMMFRLKENITSKYFMYFFHSSLFKSQYQPLIMGTTAPHLNIRDVKKFNVVICPLEEQQLIVSELESKLTVCDKIEETISQSLQQAETLRQSILKQAFEGKLINNESGMVLNKK